MLPVAALTLVPASRDLATGCTTERRFPTLGAVELMANVVLLVPPVLLLGVAVRRPSAVCLGAIVASGLIEVTQAFAPALGRSCSTSDCARHRHWCGSGFCHRSFDAVVAAACDRGRLGLAKCADLPHHLHASWRCWGTMASVTARLVRAGELVVSGQDQAEADSCFATDAFQFHGAGGVRGRLRGPDRVLRIGSGSVRRPVDPSRRRRRRRALCPLSDMDRGHVRPRVHPLVRAPGAPPVVQELFGGLVSLRRSRKQGGRTGSHYGWATRSVAGGQIWMTSSPRR